MIQLAAIMVFLTIMIATTLAMPGQISEIAKRGCQSKCGDLRIPFPFGIGSSHCFYDKWFEVVCNGTSKSRPFLKQIPEVEILSIDIERGVLQTRNPVTFFHCPNRTKRLLPVNLTGSPFSFSDSLNRLTVLGCGAFAYLDTNPDDDNMFRAAGCSAKCAKTSTENATDKVTRNINKGSDTRECCQTIIPSYLTTYKILLDKNLSFESEKRCTYAFMVDQDWYEGHSKDFDEIRSMDYVPVTLNWDLLYYEKLGIWRPIVQRSFRCAETEATSLIDGTRLQCWCNYGYGNANPYLLKGCREIDECGRNSTLCPDDTICVNTGGSYRCEYRNKVRPLFIGIASGLGAMFVVLGGWGFHRVVKRRKDIKRKEKFFKQNGGLLLQQQISSGEASFDSKTKLFNSHELEKATDHFNVNRILGQGGQGTVYKGMLADGKIVAVKKSKLVSQGRVAEFVNEVVILSQINHRNVVKLLGCYLETAVPLLVYEYIPNGTLYHYLHNHEKDFQLTWETRIRIAAEVAGALSYLHSSAATPIYHRDIKSTNILLDDKYGAKVADFGTSRSISLDQTHLTTRVSGTFGYMDPEYFRSSQFTEKSDVYSFGIVILELLSGQKPVSVTSSNKGGSLAASFIECVEENRMFDFVDAQLAKEGYYESISAVALLAYRCLNMNGRNRPTMKEVAAELEKIKKSLKVSSHHDPGVFERTQECPKPVVITGPHDQFVSISKSNRPGSCSTSGVAQSLDASTCLSLFNSTTSM